MKLWIFSDLHLEYDHHFELTPPDADVCVVAGDVRRGCGNSIKWLSQNVVPFMPVVFVAGNHEFYSDSVVEGLEWARYHAEVPLGVHFLENSDCFLGDVRFLGCTLWTDYALHGKSDEDIAWSMRNADGLLNDHRLIAYRQSPQYEGFPPSKARELHMQSRQWLDDETLQPFDGPVVVVTHHAPHPNSVNERFKGSALNPAFASDLTREIQHWRPDLWIHGHMHDSCDYVVGQTRVVCNPRGYGDENRNFNPGLVVEI